MRNMRGGECDDNAACDDNAFVSEVFERGFFLKKIFPKSYSNFSNSNSNLTNESPNTVPYAR